MRGKRGRRRWKDRLARWMRRSQDLLTSALRTQSTRRGILRRRAADEERNRQDELLRKAREAPMGVEDNALAKILQEEEDLWAAHQLASTDKRHWNPASTNNTSGLLTGPEYSSDDIGDGPSNVRVSAIGHNLVDHEQGAAFEALSDRPSPTALHIMDDGGRDEDEHLAHHLASLDKRPCNPSSFNQPRRADHRIDIPPATVIRED